jgi:hypothetical protein
MKENVMLEWIVENKELIASGIGSVVILAAGFIPNKYLSYIKIAKRVYDGVKKSIEKQKKEKK